MTLEELKQTLANDYELVCFEDLDSLLKIQHNPLWHVIKQWHQLEYSPEQKLVFYTVDRPSLTQLCMFQSIIASVDISNCFILICGPFDLSDDLSQALLQHGHDDVAIESMVCNINPTSSTSLSHNTIASAMASIL